MQRHSARAPSQRQLRVGEEVRHLLAQVLGRGELRDPFLADRTITVTEVRISPDLKKATAFVLPLAGAETEEVMAGLKRSAPHLRGLVAQEMRLRYAPQISFELDRTFDHAARIAALLHSPAVERDLTEDDDETDGA